jgi:ABC-type nitrate/sulfonate/bicarbonate transport system substrate-binding protein
VDAAVTPEPTSAAVTAREDEAHILLSTTAATHHRRHLSPGRTLIDQAPGTVRDFVQGWFDGIEMIKRDPATSYALVGRELKLDAETVSGMLSGLKLTPYADNAQFYGLAGGKAHYETLFETAFVIWRKKGLVTRPVSAKDWADVRFISSLAASYPGQKVEEPKLATRKATAEDRAIITSRFRFTSPRVPTRSCRARTSSSTRSARR